MHHLATDVSSALTPAILALVMAAGGIAGCMGALLGLGGGVFLVPFLNVVLGLPFKVAAAISLMTVIATSSTVSAASTGRNLINLRLGMVLEVASAAGGLMAGITLHYVSERVLFLGFAVVALAIAGIMMTRLDKRNVLPAGVDPGLLGGTFYDEESGRDVVYRVRRLPLALAASFLAGNVSGFLGIGGGILKVPVLNAWCGVPMRAAAATSALMIGVTAAASAPIHFANGYIVAPLAAAAVLGVLFGSRAGMWFGGRARAKWLKVLMICVLATVAGIYWFKTP
jgi:uncharacterized membrane protein YfcA